MIKVNLLPTEFRKKKKVPFFDRYLLYALLLVVLGSIVLWVQSTQQQAEINRLDDEIARAEAEIQRYQKQIKMVEEYRQLRDKIRVRISAIQELDLQRPLMVKTLENCTALVPDFLQLTEFNEVERIVSIKGQAYNLTAIANLIIGLIKSENFDEIRLIFIREIGQRSSSYGGVYEFELSGNLIFQSMQEYAGEFIAPQLTPEQEEEEDKPKSGLVAKGREALELDKDRAREAVKGLGR